MSEPTMREPMMLKIREFFRHLTGRAAAAEADDATRRTEAAEAALRGVPPEARERLAQRLKRELADVAAPALLLAVAVLALPGCSALAQALGVDPRATAPAYSGVGVVVLGSPDTRVTVPARTDQSGAVGATGKASSDAEQTSSAEIPAEAVQAMVQAAEALLAAGKPDAAAALLARVAAKKAAETPAPKADAAPPVAPAPVPAAPTAPESPAAPIAPVAPAEPVPAPSR